MDMKLVNKVCATSASAALELHKMAKNTNSGDKSKTTNTGEEKQIKKNPSKDLQWKQQSKLGGFNYLKWIKQSLLVFLDNINVIFLIDNTVILKVFHIKC